jgi:hypothetical protein
MGAASWVNGKSSLGHGFLVTEKDFSGRGHPRPGRSSMARLGGSRRKATYCDPGVSAMPNRPWPPWNYPVSHNARQSSGRRSTDRLETEQHQHVGPVIAGAVVKTLIRTKLAIGSLARQGAFNPNLAFSDLFSIIQQIGQFDVALEPIGKFLPALFTFAIFAQPCVVLLLEPCADLGKVAGQTLTLAFEIGLDPTLDLDRPNWKRNELAR